MAGRIRRHVSHWPRATGRTRRTAIVLVAALVLGVCLPAAAHDPSAFAQGRAAYLSGRHAEAARWFIAHLRAHPKDAAGWVWLGASYYQLRMSAEAVASFERAMQVRSSGEAALWLGAACVLDGHADQARQAFTRAARSGPSQTALVAQQWLRSLQGQSVPVLTRNAAPGVYAYVVRWYNPSLTPTQVDAIVRSVLYYSSTYTMDPRFVMSLIAVESGFHITARSPAGAYGLGQLMPATWQSMGVHPADPVGNIYATVRYLRGQMDRFGQNATLALAAYNAGRGAVERAGGIPPYQETQWYVYNVLTLYHHLAGEQ